MRISCGCPKATATPTLLEEIEGLNIKPIVTEEVIRVVYEGPDRHLGEAIVELFSREDHHDVTVFLTPEEQARTDRKTARKQERARKNAKLHGH